MDQIRSILEFIRNEANQAMIDRQGHHDDLVKLGNLTNTDNQPNPDVADSVVLSLYGIHREQAVPVHSIPGSGGINRGHLEQMPPLYINLHLMFVANFGNTSYSDGLAQLSKLIGHFQSVPTFTPDTRPDLPTFASKITLEFMDLGIKDTHDVMRMMGVTYRPAVFYRLRTIPLGPAPLRHFAIPVRGAAET